MQANLLLDMRFTEKREALMNRFSKRVLIGFLLVLVSAILLFVVFVQIESSFKAKYFPWNQQNTFWSSPDGAFTIAVSDEATTSMDGHIQRYAYEAYIMWSGERYSVSFGFDSTGYIPLIRDGRSPHHVDLCLHDSEGIIIETVSCKYDMPNKHTLRLSPIDQQSPAILPETLILVRVDPE